VQIWLGGETGACAQSGHAEKAQYKLFGRVYTIRGIRERRRGAGQQAVDRTDSCILCYAPHGHGLDQVPVSSRNESPWS
jgi:hypothetical protein